jgi:hypothetical protein
MAAKARRALPTGGRFAPEGLVGTSRAGGPVRPGAYGPCRPEVGLPRRG